VSQKDWNEVESIINTKNKNYLTNFINSNELFLPNKNQVNPFTNSTFSIKAKDINKSKPGSWIPIYKESELSDFFIKNNIIPIRCGESQFFFYKGNIFFNLKLIDFISINLNIIEPIYNFIPITLKSKIPRNENAYLNKSIALGIINHFVKNKDLKPIEYKLENERLLYGQFGKIKTINNLEFKTSKGNNHIKKNFQFEIDMVLENKEEIFIFEAKLGQKTHENFSLLQLYYPYIYIKYILDQNKIENKKIRTIFIDIETNEDKEIYKLLEIEFLNGNFDEVKVLKKYEYSI